VFCDVCPFAVHLTLMDSNRAGLDGGIKVGWPAAYLAAANQTLN